MPKLITKRTTESSKIWEISKFIIILSINQHLASSTGINLCNSEYYPKIIIIISNIESHQRLFGYCIISMRSQKSMRDQTQVICQIKLLYFINSTSQMWLSVSPEHSKHNHNYFQKVSGSSLGKNKRNVNVLCMCNRASEFW